MHLNTSLFERACGLDKTFLILVQRVEVNKLLHNAHHYFISLLRFCL